MKVNILVLHIVIFVISPADQRNDDGAGNLLYISLLAAWFSQRRIHKKKAGMNEDCSVSAHSQLFNHGFSSLLSGLIF